MTHQIGHERLGGELLPSDREPAVAEAAHSRPALTGPQALQLGLQLTERLRGARKTCCESSISSARCSADIELIEHLLET